jgi:hypothetical protein
MRETPVCQAEKEKAVAKTAENATAAHAPAPPLSHPKPARYGEESNSRINPPKSKEYVATVSGE